VLEGHLCILKISFQQRRLGGKLLIIKNIPVELLPIFKERPEHAVRDFGSVTTEAINPFFRRRQKITACISETPNPFDEETLTFQKDYRCGNREYPRYGHADLSLGGDAVGIAVAHVPRFVPVGQVRKGDDRMRGERAPFVVIDFTGRIETAGAEEFILGDLRSVIYDFIARGFDLALFTFDRFQSSDSIQQLRARGICSEVLSIDRTMYRIILDKHAPNWMRKESVRDICAAQEALRQAMYEDRLSVPFHPYWKIECEGAERIEKTGKVDHSPGGSFDMEQAVAGAVFNAVSNEIAGIESQDDAQDWEEDEYYAKNPRRSKDDDYEEDDFYDKFQEDW